MSLFTDSELNAIEKQGINNERIQVETAAASAAATSEHAAWQADCVHFAIKAFNEGLDELPRLYKARGVSPVNVFKWKKHAIIKIGTGAKIAFSGYPIFRYGDEKIYIDTNGKFHKLCGEYHYRHRRDFVVNFVCAYIFGQDVLSDFPQKDTEKYIKDKIKKHLNDLVQKQKEGVIYPYYVWDNGWDTQTEKECFPNLK